jgi:hypothetical protein
MSGCGILTSGCGILMSGCGILMSGCGILMSGCGILMSGCGILMSGCGILMSGCVFLTSGCGILMSGCGILTSGCGILMSGCGILMSGFILFGALFFGWTWCVRVGTGAWFIFSKLRSEIVLDIFQRLLVVGNVVWVSADCFVCREEHLLGFAPCCAGQSAQCVVSLFDFGGKCEKCIEKVR